MFPPSLRAGLALALLPVSGVLGAFDLGFQDDSDLTHFVTRPEIKAPLFNVDLKKPELITPGYWFIAPYASIMQDSFARSYYQPCQTGPAIYDSNGDLVWSGACMVKNQNTCDFRLVEGGNSSALSAIFMSEGDDGKGLGVVLDSSFAAIKNVSTPKLTSDFNMHELNLVHGGKSALHILHRQDHVELDDDLDTDLETGWIGNMGFREVDVDTGKTLFEWWAYPEVRLQESKVRMRGLDGPHPNSWNWFHMNSIDKNDNGDYMVSARFTDTIYKISGKTGKLEWRLEGSGTKSSFVHESFNFSRQHDARWLEHSETREVISLLDNAADSHNETSEYSSALIVELDKAQEPWTARVLTRWVRPDGKLSRQRGNSQVLGNGNIFNCWSDNSYLSEHSPDGQVLMEARFKSERFVTYRGYKFNFSSTPAEPPVLKSFVYGTEPDRSTTVSYVSWNGATDVSSWNFYQTQNSTGDAVLLDRKQKTGFETSVQTDGYAAFVFAEAISSDGSVLGRTETFEIAPPADWRLPETRPREHQVESSLSYSVALPQGSLRAGDDTGHPHSSACSVYGDGCRPIMKLEHLGVMPLEKTEL